MLVRLDREVRHLLAVLVLTLLIYSKSVEVEQLVES